MEWIWTCYENLINIIQAFILINCITEIYGVKYWKNKPIITKVIGTFVYTTMLVLSNYIVGFEGMGIIGFGLLIGIYGIFLLEGKWYVMLPIAMLEALVMVFVSTIVILLTCLVTGIDGAKLAYAICPERFFALILTQVLLAAGLKAIADIIKKKWNPLNRNEGKIFALIFFLSVLAFFCITQTVMSQEMKEMNEIRLLCACGALIALNVICLQMLNDLARKRRIETENLLLKGQAEFQKKYAKAVKQQYDEMKRLRHDMRQHYSVLENLLVQEKYGLMEEYLLKSIETIENRENLIYIENEYVNAILNRKISHAREQKIDVRINLPERFSGVDEMDLCNLLGTLMDNAEEACEKVAHKKIIELTMEQDADKVFIEMKNSINQPVLMRNKELSTSKSDKSTHGYGMKTVKKIIKKYEGHMDIWEEKGKFCMNLILYFGK
ncbi:MAG: GHKL domain-containing protein [Roseburia sp.]|nr:GHKL domain-containing protein [Roseburia sp.]MCM1279081.1 GHKL domain-containing protein [Robinsoniella sp.]